MVPKLPLCLARSAAVACLISLIPQSSEAAAAKKHAAPTPAPASLVSAGLDPMEENYRQATALLYGQTEDGGLRMLCTATAFERKGKVYHFVTAAHCVSSDDTLHDRVDVEKTNWYITFDEPERKNFFPAKVVGVGFQHRGDDFSVFEVTLDDVIPVIGLAEHDPVLGEDVSNFASPLGLGKQLFRGHISMEALDRPIIDGDINWKGATLLQMSSGPGSSGSSIVSRHQKGIVAFLVGVIAVSNSPNIVSIPVSKFKKFWTEVQAGTYKWYKQDDAAAAAGTSKSKVDKLWKRIHVDGIIYTIGNDELDESSQP
ncbi:MAG: trypsin-like peptidase domain-containing protein [Patescibacteria group bacterium]|jgi:hypothetical protein